MRSLLEIQKRLLPDLLEIMQKRYEVLQSIRLAGVVGRRTLAQSLGWTERTLRSEVEFLKEQNLIGMKTSGMYLLEEGFMVLQELEGFMREITGIHKMEQEIRSRFPHLQVTIVPGDSDQSPWVKDELGAACARSIKNLLLGENIIAVTGGTTMAAVAEQLTPNPDKKLLFVPARGGIGEDVSHQANTICAKMAEQTGGKHRVLYVPDQVSREVYESFVKEPAIKEVLNLITSANIVMHGIGDALTMAKRRNTKEEELERIVNGHAVAEAFGYYFNESGKIVHKVPTIGLQLEDLENAKDVIAVAGGASKGKAIRAYLQGATKSTVLITDEAAAKVFLEGC
ncbi:MAG TPA: sugar-binding domain-containing protein [Chondromyces sp.]|nr:sugar-binding domain-containing protein [Chondromyces sp.]